MSIIDDLKNNEKPFGLMSEEMQEKAKEIGKANFLWFSYECQWKDTAIKIHFCEINTYRLKPDYQELKKQWKCVSRDLQGTPCKYLCIISSEFEPKGCLSTALFEKWILCEEQNEQSIIKSTETKV